MLPLLIFDVPKTVFSLSGGRNALTIDLRITLGTLHMCKFMSLIHKNSDSVD